MNFIDNRTKFPRFLCFPIENQSHQSSITSTTQNFYFIPTWKLKSKTWVWSLLSYESGRQKCLKFTFRSGHETKENDETFYNRRLMLSEKILMYCNLYLKPRKQNKNKKVFWKMNLSREERFLSVIILRDIWCVRSCRLMIWLTLSSFPPMNWVVNCSNLFSASTYQQNPRLS